MRTLLKILLFPVVLVLTVLVVYLMIWALDLPIIPTRTIMALILIPWTKPQLWVVM